jgi:hypothetical protein
MDIEKRFLVRIVPGQMPPSQTISEEAMADVLQNLLSKWTRDGCFPWTISVEVFDALAFGGSN